MEDDGVIEDWLCLAVNEVAGAQQRCHVSWAIAVVHMDFVGRIEIESAVDIFVPYVVVDNQA